jgi:uncharacterized repeat protein (TIGR01451 family)
VLRVQPLRSRSSLCKTWLGGLVIATLMAIDPAIADDSQSKITNQAQYKYNVVNSDNNLEIEGDTNLVRIDSSSGGLVDPLGTITGCDGKALASYEGYTVALYDIAADRLNPTALLALAPTEFPDDPNNRIPVGLAPNIQNKNPFPLLAKGEGTYNFLFDRTQLAVGKSYLLLVKPPAQSIYGERRVRIDITSFTNNVLGYQATALDGKPLSTTENSAKTATVKIADAATTGLSLVSLQGLGTSVCDLQPIQIVKSADRATAEPGDTVVYRLTLKNQSDKDIRTLTVTDTLPLGMFFRPNTVRAQLGSIAAPVTVTQQGNVLTFKIDKLGFVVPARQVVELGYAVTLEVDAIRGTGRNSATLSAIRSDGTTFTDGPAIHLLSIRQGIIRDTGTIVGRVFVDKNFDGQQQGNEPGIPNAVIFTDDGNRITTDVNGLFSVQSAVAGYRTGTIDLTSLPGYSLAPNRYFSERNSASRLVKLAPGGIVRMNFGVTPTAREVKK